MLSTQFYSQLTTCPVCKGWGTEKVPPLKSGPPCKECGGLGVFLAQSEQTYVWGLPTFIDFKKRKQIRILKIILFVSIIIFFAVVYYLISQITLPSFKLIQ